METHLGKSLKVSSYLRQFKAVIAVAIIATTSVPVEGASNDGASKSAAAMPVQVPTTITQFFTPDLQQQMGISIRYDASNNNYIEVVSDSVASKAGLMSGDVLIDAHDVGDDIEIIYQRAGKKATVKIRDSIAQPSLQAMVPKSDAVQQQDREPFTLSAQKHGRTEVVPPVAPPIPTRIQRPLPAAAEQNELAMGSAKFATGANRQGPLKGNVSVRRLTDYQLELIVDRSASMARPVAPGLSRWDWFGTQINALASQLSPILPEGLTITTFAAPYEVYEHSSAKDIARVFSQSNFSGGTRMNGPLADRLQSYFSRRRPGSKPLLVGIVTDGIPHPPDEMTKVQDTIIAATQRMKYPHEVTVVFFRIGSDNDNFRRRHVAGAHSGKRHGRLGSRRQWFNQRATKFLSECDSGLVNYGARYDIVQVVNFEELKRTGLAQAMVNSIKDFALRNQTSGR